MYVTHPKKYILCGDTYEQYDENRNRAAYTHGPRPNLQKPKTLVCIYIHAEPIVPFFLLPRFLLYILIIHQTGEFFSQSYRIMYNMQWTCFDSSILNTICVYIYACARACMYKQSDVLMYWIYLVYFNSMEDYTGLDYSVNQCVYPYDQNILFALHCDCIDQSLLHDRLISTWEQI